MVSTISGSVGKSGVNNKVDVRIVQRLLNDWLCRTKQLQLTVDGVVGPKTTSAIIEFQRHNACIADGRIDPSGRTLRALLAQHVANIASMIDPSRLGRAVDFSRVLSGYPEAPISGLIENYIAALRKSA